MKIFSLLFIILATTCFIEAQTDTVNKKKVIPFTPDFRFKDGIYMNYADIKNNNPISGIRIVTELDPEAPDFYAKITESEKLLVLDNFGQQVEVKTKQIWGYCQKGIIFVNWNKEFNRVTYIGTLCHFVANYITYDNPMSPYYYGYNPYSSYYGYPQMTPSNELRQYILNFNTGQILDYNVKSVEVSLMDDPALYDEFNALSKRKKKQVLFLYLRKYNEKHPLMVPAD
jgi:hypothetical protein